QEVDALGLGEAGAPAVGLGGAGAPAVGLLRDAQPRVQPPEQAFHRADISRAQRDRERCAWAGRVGAGHDSRLGATTDISPTWRRKVPLELWTPPPRPGPVEHRGLTPSRQVRQVATCAAQPEG